MRSWKYRKMEKYPWLSKSNVNSNASKSEKSRATGEESDEIDEITRLIVLEDVLIAALVAFFEKNPDRLPVPSSMDYEHVLSSSENSKPKKKVKVNNSVSMDEEVPPKKTGLLHLLTKK